MAGQPGRSGGHRPGSGEKPHQMTTASGTKAPLGPVETFDPPSFLSAAEVGVWSDLAPYAFAARTLTRQTAMAFADLCKSRVLVAELEVDPDKRGGTDHRNMIQRVQSQMKDFSLAPFGKPVISEAPKDEDPFAKFDVQ